jgi:glucose-1-phosphate cytidylyltransferase
MPALLQKVESNWGAFQKDAAMKVAILAGGFGTRLAEETDVRPKPMVEIGGSPILWHIMSHYAFYGFKDFYIALGYRGDFIKRYFIDYHVINSRRLSISIDDGSINVLDRPTEDWTVTLVDTGLNVNTGGRIKRLQSWLGESTFMASYGDGVCNVNLEALLAFHKSHGRIATVTAVRPPARFGGLTIENHVVTTFAEKPQIGEGWINGGFFVFEPAIFNYLQDDHTILEADALEKLAREGQLMAFQHADFWQCMDTLRDKRLLDSLWETGKAPWKLW